jgi:hypothetical protein
VPQHFSNSMLEILNSFGVQAVGIVHDANSSSLVGKCQSALRNSPSGAIRFVCIVGSWDEVPPIRVVNDLIDDGDAFCLSDAFYGAPEDFNPADPLTAIPDIAVGRIPVADRTIVQRILAREPDVEASLDSFLFGVTAECWKAATAAIVSSFSNLSKGSPIDLLPGDTDTLPKSVILSSPRWTEESLRQSVGSGPTDAFGLILFNVHGSPDETHWVGEGQDGYVQIFQPNTVANFNSAFLISEACYGGAMSYDTPSIVEQFFENGGQSFVGSSTIAYGAPSTPISAADLIARHYVNGLYGGLSQGESLKVAKMEALAEDPLSIEIGLKTVLSFNLFGAPWQPLLREHTTSRPGSQMNSIMSAPSGSVLSRVRGSLSTPISSNNDTVKKFRDQYRSRLPLLNRQFMVERENVLTKLREFRDFSKIRDEVRVWGGILEDSKMDFVSAGEAEGYRLFCHTMPTSKSKRTLVLSINKSGQLTKTVTSKGE